ncbi:Uncharacterized transporter YwrA [[Clostridium] ultunense Esp]|uniref:chromate transporter n=1 Tax=Thermicanus aegyptius TaxID=94009 RepID=UPI0002B6EF24|nr:chromate transporter [Thermicanus aegyptius]MBE3555075.1 chromate transporter [Thermicanus sp.]CCQ97054.1 Uncharacterized transporter YwrA [[Clostridium] ultunense Esp]
MIYFQLFWAFFIANLLGYGGGPPSIPLIQNEVVNHYRWATVKEFGEVLAVGNALPSPINTKLAAYFGYQVGGLLGAVVALFATIAPSAVAMVLLFKAVTYFKDAPQVKAMTESIRPVVTVLLGALTYQFLAASVGELGILHTGVLVLLSFYLMERKKLHPALMILLAMGYGALTSFL